MKKRILLGITLTMLVMAVGIAMASNGNGNGNGKETARVIADTTGIMDKLNFNSTYAPLKISYNKGKD